ncbi:Hint domain-containing protein [Bifidobacterium sp. SO1]|uniref:Hint domain-containing protein n=1 Tax=Bifidobacterium sp. SO1 TaxID=2809029 RepID=UPI001BDBEA32|nr:Hint domain-containing protein [Bifidobacterium sp. SO1]MBT1161789.1 Hint domain-containing protein [Bifidobacterium sp. SO1]
MSEQQQDNGLIGSLFTGYGGLDMGVNMALGGGMRVAYTSDIEPGPTAIERYHAHGDDCPNLGDITRLDKDNLPYTDVICGGSPCFPAGSLVLTDHGFMPIEHVKVGDRVLTHKGNWKPVTDIGSHIGDTIILRGQGTPGIECTPNTLFLTCGASRQWSPRKNGYERIQTDFKWVPVNDLIGRWICNVASVPPLSIPEFQYPNAVVRRIRMDTAFFYFVGRFLGDGWLSIVHMKNGKGDSCRVHICDSFDKEREMIDHFNETDLHFYKSYTATTVKFTCYSMALYRWLYENFGKGAKGKRIPSWVFGMRKEWRDALIRGYRDSDGSKTKNGWTALSVSENLILGMKTLMLMEGKGVSLSSYQAHRAHYLRGGLVKDSRTYNLAIFDHSKLGFIRPDSFWGRVRRAEEGRKGERLYGLRVEDDCSYTVDGIAVSGL